MIYSAILMIILYSNSISSIELTDPAEYQEKVAWGQYVYTEGAYPYYASIKSPMPGRNLGYFHTCGGSLLGARIMLTAAHCLMNASLIPLLRVFPNYRNTPMIMSGDLVFTITSYVIHPETNFGSQVDPYSKHDIAVVLLNRLDPRMGATISLPFMPLPPCTLVTVIGLGLTESGDLPYRLKEALVYTLSDEECIDEAETIGYAPILNICTTNKYGASACPGDSGGPLIWENPQNNKSYVHGVVSNGDFPCNGFKVTVYVSVYAHLNFINHAILRLAHDELRSGQVEYVPSSMDYK